MLKLIRKTKCLCADNIYTFKSNLFIIKKVSKGIKKNKHILKVINKIITQLYKK